MPETLGALPAPAEARTWAVVLTAPPVGAALAALMISAYLLFPWRPGPLAGRFDVGEALTGVALAAPAAALGAVYEGLAYCVYPGYRNWIPVWAKALRPIVSAVPEQARARIPAISQRPAVPGASIGRPGTWPIWSTDPAEHQAMLVGQVAREVTGVRDFCDGVGLAKSVVALWLVGRAGPLLDAPPPAIWRDRGRSAQTRGVRRVPMRGNGELFLAGQLIGMPYGAAEVGYARRLLERPGAVQRVRANWTRLTAPDTTIGQALPLLGLREEFPATKVETCG